MKTKRFLLTFLAMIGLIFSSYAQLGSPIRPAAQSPADNTGRSQSYGQNTQFTVVGTTDTILVYPNQGENIVTPTDSVLGTAIYVEAVLPGNFVGDVMKFMGVASNLNTPKIAFRNKYHTVFKFSTAADSTITLNKLKQYYVGFVWTGQYWLETGKALGQ
jgi:hypothetical protein